MRSISYATFLFSAYILIFVSNEVSSDEVPAILWNIKGNGLLVKPVSALGRHDSIFKDSLKDALEDNANILVFAVNKLSLEDFSASEKPVASNNTLQNLQTFLETQRYMFLSSVKEPLSYIHEVHCGVQEIVVDQGIDDNVLQAISVAFDRSCVVILHITDAGVVGVKDPKLEEIKKVFLPSFEKTSKNIVGFFTAMKSSWGKSNDEHHKFRNLLAADEENSAESKSNFLNITGCLIMYADNATLYVRATNKTISLPVPATSEGSWCGNYSALLNLNFKLTEEYYSTVLVKFNFTLVSGSFVTITTVETTGGAKSDVREELLTKDLTAPSGFSFSCGSYELISKNRSAPHYVTLSFERFQVQPFGVNQKFGESFDCVTWFTVPIWMGIFVSLLFIAIINCGVYALFSVNTMDRFDDPKGKTITVAATND